MGIRKRYQPWLNALRSGEYKQGRTSLVQTTKEGDKLYCCLGVLGVLENVPQEGYGQFIYEEKLTGGFWPVGSPLEVKYKLNSKALGSMSPVQGVLANWNDVEMLSFVQIADKFEAEILPLLEAEEGEDTGAD